MTTHYLIEPNPQEMNKTKALAISGSGSLASILLASSVPFLPFGLAAAGIGLLGASIAKYIKGKKSATPRKALDEYCKDETGSTILIKYKINKNKTHAKLGSFFCPSNKALPKEAQDYIDNIAINREFNQDYEMIIEKKANGKYAFKNKVKDLNGNEADSPEFNFIDLKYLGGKTNENTSNNAHAQAQAQSQAAQESQNTNAKKREMLEMLKNAATKPQQIANENKINNTLKTLSDVIEEHMTD
ncbi:MAG: hypothetical protein PHT91_01345 [Candidatus Nanoarchaeia archaeon]|nr:hypothetical protein [Candidatus Nanoarchaeia archaeon]